MLRHVITITSGSCTGMKGRAGRDVSIGPEWDSDVTLLDMPATAPPARFSIRVLPRPLVILREGTGVHLGSRPVAAGERMAISGEGLALTIADTGVLIAPERPVEAIRRIAEARAARLRGDAGRWKDRARPAGAGRTAMGVLAICVLAGGVAYTADIRTTERKNPAPRAGTAPAVPVTVSAILDRAARDGVVPSPDLAVTFDGTSGFVMVTPGTDTDRGRRAAEAFGRWYDTQTDLPPLIHRKGVVPPSAAADRPDIGMVLSGQGARPPVVISGDGKKVTLGSHFASGWLYERYEDGLLVFRRGPETIRVRPNS